jgi:hypothetical protein
VGRGIEAARIAAWLLTRRVAGGSDPELLALAALCQDCGLLPLTRRSRSAPDLSPQVRDLHPSIGAGLVAGLVEFSTQLPALVAQHHRRLNDPRITPDLPGRIQNRDSRLLAIVVRWVELIDERRSETTAVIPPAGRLALAEPARRLVRETLRGDWDRQIAGDLLGAFEFGAESQSLREVGTIASPFENRDGSRRRLDSADERWPALNLELATQSREKHHVRAPER